MALARGLNELALANSEGLLHDDEYRLLRQNLFEQHMTTSVFPAEAPIVPLAGSGHNLPTPSHHSRQQTSLASKVDYQRERPPLLRPKWTSSVVTFLRRATNRNQTTSFSENDVKSSTHDIAKRSGITRTLQKKASELFIRTSGQKTEQGPMSASLRPETAVSDTHSMPSRPHSPYRSVGHVISTNSPPKVDISSIADVYEDGNMYSVNDIRAAIMATEAEAERVLAAFNNLEISTMQRIHQKTVRRLPSVTATHTDILVEGKEWRDHSFLPQSPGLPAWKRRISPTIDISDAVSVQSESSTKTSLSQSKSISSLRSKQTSGSPLLSRFPVSSPSIHRQNSVSSISSRTPSSRRPRINRSLSLSRSTGHLPLSTLAERTGMRSDDSGVNEVTDESNIPSEVLDIRNRSREVTARYEARIDYLHAKLKSAKLHEKLLRK